MSYPTITCPTGCNNDVPAINMDECNPSVDFSEVDKLYMTAIDQGLSDWTDPAEWASRIDNAGVGVDDIREWWVSGELPEPERNITPIDNAREVSSPMTFNLDLQVFDLDTDTYDAGRILQCGLKVLIWFSAGAYMYGGTDGIEVSIISSHIITKGSKEVNFLKLLVKWEDEFNPERIDNPLA